jgi:hypothetical protein
MNREQIRNVKEVVATYLKVLAIKYLEIMSKSKTNKIDYNPFEIRPGYLQNTSLERCS